MFFFLNLLPSEALPQPIAAEIIAPKNLHGKKVDLIAQTREGDRETFEIEIPTEPNIPSEGSTEVTPPSIEKVEVVEIIADRQEYDQTKEVITAEGDVVLRFSQAVLTSDRMQVNLADRIVVAEGNVVLTRGDQIIEGDKFEYYLVQDRGVVINAEGQIDRTTLGRDLSQQLPEDETLTNLSLSDRLAVNQPITDVTAQSDFEFSVGSKRDLGILDGKRIDEEAGTINRVRFEAERMEFEPDGWQATNISITNDPFSPPELELRAETAKFQQTAPLVNELTTTKSRVVIDDGFSFPLLKNSFVFDGRPRSPGLFSIGFDGDERGGLFVERAFTILDQDQTIWTVTPQYFLQRAIFTDAFDFNRDEDGGIIDPGVFGVKSFFSNDFSDRSSVDAKFSISGFNEPLDDNIRAKLAARQLIGNLQNPYDFSLEFNFRERLFNGSLGFQTVYNSIGGIVTSPIILLGKTGISLRYQGSIQNINADTDRLDLLEVNRDNNRTNLTRFQGAAFLGKGFLLWQGKALPISRKEALRFSPVPVVPYLQLNTGLSGVTSFYSNNDGQHSLRGSIGIQGQVGHFSRSWFDYTGFNATYSIGTNADESPFLFDRDADQQTLALGITQQLYGPIRLGVQTSFNIDNGDDINTDYIIEYSRRTHNITLRYSPELEIGSFSFRINDFNWRGNAEPFKRNDIRPVTQGVSR
ncbi:organic solvent tolerance protein OstA [Xenococcus sp. PCC 7305]|uniref:DUF3769 domain-containing protein n=1 Tax=Xenococcus sp. PCC 7305 TaxID=102125 RepID=UPI0002ABA5C8|nr:DUF3769 domain-containing protein [Xenococcus sp. PCC 7305]ELS02972.1 organic solvent tolerance protein OstA [Xenococcus sp. PCC 7305]